MARGRRKWTGRSGRRGGGGQATVEGAAYTYKQAEKNCRPSLKLLYRSRLPLLRLLLPLLLPSATYSLLCRTLSLSVPLSHSLLLLLRYEDNLQLANVFEVIA